MTTVYRNATVFTADGASDGTSPAPEAFAVTEGLFTVVGTLTEVRAAIGDEDADEVDLEGRFVAPGIIDSHTHLMSFGESLGKVPLRDCATLEQIQQRLTAARAGRPDEPRLLGVGWLFDAVGEDRPTAAMLDAVLPDVPVYLDANDLHSVWVNSAALAELGIDRNTPDPIGGEIARDAEGNPTGMLYETAGTQYAWRFLSETTTVEDRVRFLDAAFQAYLEVGVTTATDMSLAAEDVDALLTIFERDGRLPFPVTAHWILEPSGNEERDLAGVRTIVELRDRIAQSAAAPWVRVAGVKFIMDGVIDACTATMRAPYADGSNAEPIWTLERVLPVALAADAAGLQIAMHAIGDRTSEIALDTVEQCIRINGPRNRRHRVEHLESVADTTITRMADLGVVASMQPVHCDPAVLDNWKAVLGDERQERGFPWQRFRELGVALTLGTDAPTAPHPPLPNLYIALTGASALAPALPPYHPERAFTPAQALTALTTGGAFAGMMDHLRGRIEPGLEANFIVLDVNPLEAPPEALLDARVVSTFVCGEQMTGAC